MNANIILHPAQGFTGNIICSLIGYPQNLNDANVGGWQPKGHYYSALIIAPQSQVLASHVQPLPMSGNASISFTGLPSMASCYLEIINSNDGIRANGKLGGLHGFVPSMAPLSVNNLPTGSPYQNFAPFECSIS